MGTGSFYVTEILRNSRYIKGTDVPKMHSCEDVDRRKRPREARECSRHILFNMFAVKNVKKEDIVLKGMDTKLVK